MDISQVFVRDIFFHWGSFRIIVLPLFYMESISFVDCEIFFLWYNKNDYAEMYQAALEKKVYNIKMIDGALLTLLYRFSNDRIVAHRLSYFPAPDLIAFQNEPELYAEDELYVDILDRRIVTVPIRFDFDDIVRCPLEHPASHLTLGQYKNCRIPVSSALTPYQFISFIIANFYHSADFQSNLQEFKDKFDESILTEERELIHINTPIYRN